MKENFQRVIREEARLIILRSLSEQIDGRLNSELLKIELERFGISKPKGWVHDELAYLEEMGAVTLAEAGSVKIATLTDKGDRHLNRTLIIDGVKRPSLHGG